MKQVTLYTLSTCPWPQGEEVFRHRNIPFTYIDNDLADEATQEKISKELDAAGATGFPFVKIGDKVILGSQPDVYSRTLGL